jgi:hypothetical protein
MINASIPGTTEFCIQVKRDQLPRIVGCHIDGRLQLQRINFLFPMSVMLQQPSLSDLTLEQCSFEPETEPCVITTSLNKLTVIRGSGVTCDLGPVAEVHLKYVSLAQTKIKYLRNVTTLVALHHCDGCEPLDISTYIRSEKLYMGFVPGYQKFNTMQQVKYVQLCDISFSGIGHDVVDLDCKDCHIDNLSSDRLGRLTLRNMRQMTVDRLPYLQHLILRDAHATLGTLIRLESLQLHDGSGVVALHARHVLQLKVIVQDPKSPDVLPGVLRIADRDYCAVGL